MDYPDSDFHLRPITSALQAQLLEWHHDDMEWLFVYRVQPIGGAQDSAEHLWLGGSHKCSETGGTLRWRRCSRPSNRQFIAHFRRVSLTTYSCSSAAASCESKAPITPSHSVAFLIHFDANANLPIDIGSLSSFPALYLPRTRSGHLIRINAVGWVMSALDTFRKQCHCFAVPFVPCFDKHTRSHFGVRIVRPLCVCVWHCPVSA